MGHQRTPSTSLEFPHRAVSSESCPCTLGERLLRLFVRGPSAVCVRYRQNKVKPTLYGEFRRTGDFPAECGGNTGVDARVLGLHMLENKRQRVFVIIERHLESLRRFEFSSVSEPESEPRIRSESESHVVT